MEPFLAIGEILRDHGHNVICVFPEQYGELATDSGFQFISLGSEYIEIVESADGKAIMGGGGSHLRRIRTYIRLYRKATANMKDLVARQHKIIDQESPDLVIYSGKATYPVIWGISNPGKTVLISPVPCLIHYTRTLPHIGFKFNLGPIVNKWTYDLANFGFVKNITSTTKAIRQPHGINSADIRRQLLRNRMIYTISPSIFPRPSYWPPQVQVLGYHERTKTHNWQPDKRLTEFLESHERVIMVTFGSMINDSPAEKSRIVVSTLGNLKVPAIINIAAGGLIEPDTDYPDSILFVSRIPYDWLFPRVYAVVHHGGSGTTHMAMKYGCASMIVPHIIDQFLWNDILSDLGVGPKGAVHLNAVPLKLQARRPATHGKFEVQGQGGKNTEPDERRGIIVSRAVRVHHKLLSHQLFF